MHTVTRAASLAAMSYFVFACTGSTSTIEAGASTGSSGTSVDAYRAIVDTFCDTVAPPFCESYFACCAAPDFFLTVGPNADVAMNLPRCEHVVTTHSFVGLCEAQGRADLAAHLRDGLVVFDQAQFDSCLTLLKSMIPGGAACTEAPEHVLLTTCTSAFRGQIEPGDACPYPDDEMFYFERISSALVCKKGHCQKGKCVPYLKPGDACDLSIDQNLLYSTPAPAVCNFLNNEVCWGDYSAGGAGGAGGGGGAGGASVMGTCHPQVELGDTCDPGNVHECKSFHCDVTGKCIPPVPWPSGCQFI